MLEIVFGESAHGGLLAALQGRSGNEAVAVVVTYDDGSGPSAEEVAEARRELEEQYRREMANAVPLEGRAEDIFGFPLGLSVGDISEDIPGPLRQAELSAQLDRLLPGEEEIAPFIVSKVRDDLETLKSRMASGEAVRVWYSHQPDEMCGLCWLLTQLAPVGGDVYGVKLPEWAVKPDGTLEVYTGWGGVSPGKWASFLPLTTELPEAARRYYIGIWRGVTA